MIITYTPEEGKQEDRDIAFYKVVFDPKLRTISMFLDKIALDRLKTLEGPGIRILFNSHYSYFPMSKDSTKSPTAAWRSPTESDKRCKNMVDMVVMRSRFL